MEIPITHIQRSKCINEKMSFQPESFIVPTQVHTQFEIYQDTIEQSNFQIKPQCKQTFSFPKGPQPRAEDRIATSEKIE
jgi:hypothetical protein